MGLVLRSQGRHADFHLSYQGKTYKFSDYECTVEDEKEGRAVAAAHRSIVVGAKAKPRREQGKAKTTSAGAKSEGEA